METSDFEEDQRLTTVLDVWKSATMKFGAVCVKAIGIALMLVWLADSWDLLQ